MLIHRWAGILFLISILFLAGCGGGSDPVNLDKDKPVHPKKDK